MLTTYGGNLYADFLLGATAPAQVWLALTGTPPGAATTGSTIVEPIGGGYARTRLDALTWDAAVDGETFLVDPLLFTPSGDWGVMTYYGFCDASTAGNLITYDALPSPVSFLTGRRVAIPTRSISLKAVI
jgi:hypothetical protein